MDFGAEKFTGLIILQGKTQLEISNILDEIYFDRSYILNNDNEIFSKKNSPKILPLIIKYYYKGILLKYSFLYENTFIKEIEKRFPIKPSNYLEGIKYLKEKYLNINDVYLKRVMLDSLIKAGFIFNLKIYNNLLYSDTLNIFNINIYNEPCILSNSKLSKEQSKNIIITLTEFQKISDIPQNKWILNNIIKQYKYND